MHETYGCLKAIMFVQVTETTGNNKELLVAAYLLSNNERDLNHHFKSFRGEVLETRQGEIYACFSGAVSAFHAALSLQEMMPRFRLRIGLHLGEVIYRKGKLQGRDVNFASRLPHCARAGGICLSQSVYQYLEDHEKQILVSLGAHCLKNFDTAVPLYAYLPAGQSCRSKLREQKRQLTEKLRKYRASHWFIPSTLSLAVIMIILVQQVVDIVPDRKVLKLYVPAFEQHDQSVQQRKLVKGIEQTVRSSISGEHDSYNVHLLSRRSSAQVELLVTVNQVSGKIQAGYIINNLVEGEALTYGGFEEDESRVFYLQDRLSEAILMALRKL